MKQNRIRESEQLMTVLALYEQDSDQCMLTELPDGELHGEEISWIIRRELAGQRRSSLALYEQDSDQYMLTELPDIELHGEEISWIIRRELAGQRRSSSHRNTGKTQPKER